MKNEDLARGGNAKGEKRLKCERKHEVELKGALAVVKGPLWPKRAEKWGSRMRFKKLQKRVGCVDDSLFDRERMEEGGWPEGEMRRRESAFERICKELRYVLRQSVEKNWAEGILLSGGLDSSILALLRAQFSRDMKAFTSALEGTEAEDLIYASESASLLGVDHTVVTVSKSKAIETIEEIIFLLRTFDSAEVRNGIPILLALRSAKGEGVKKVMTGDGADELFAGYSYLWHMSSKELKTHLERLSRSMAFSSTSLGSKVGVEVKQPYLDKEVVSLALEIEPSLKVRKRKGKKWGKWILRKAFEGLLPEKFLWRVKMPIEMGSGFSILGKWVGQRISSQEFAVKSQKYGLKFRDEEHLFYYEVYRQVVGEIPHPREGERPCPWCGAGVKEEAHHCRICGACF